MNDLLTQPEPRNAVTTPKDLNDRLTLIWQRQNALATAHNELATQVAALLAQATELMSGQSGEGGTLQQVMDAINALSARIGRLETAFRNQQ